MSNNYIKDQSGKVLGFSQSQGSKTVYFDNKGSVVSRVHDNRTYDNKGAFKGYGDQGLRVLGEKKR